MLRWQIGASGLGRPGEAGFHLLSLLTLDEACGGYIPFSSDAYTRSLPMTRLPVPSRSLPFVCCSLSSRLTR